MKRLCILADYPAWFLPGMEHLPSRLGHATWLHMLRPHFAMLADEFEIHWIVMTKGIDSPVEIEIDRQVFHLVPRKRKILAMATAYQLEIRKIRNLLGTIKPDLVHAWGVEDAYAMAAASIRAYPVLFSLQGCITECIKVTPAGILMRLLGSYERYALRRIRFATGESARACENMRSIHPDIQTSIVDYGVAEAFHKIARNPTPAPSIAFVGGLFEAKGIIDLVEVMKSPSLAGIQLDIWGSGPEHGKLSVNSSPNVVWHGHATREQVIGTLGSTWALVIPTHCDTGPTVVKEARAAGVPVITTTAAGANQHVRQGVSGFITEPGDRNALEMAILEVCQSRQHALLMGGADLEPTRTALKGEASIQKFRSQYHRILAASSINTHFPNRYR